MQWAVLLVERILRALDEHGAHITSPRVSHALFTASAVVARLLFAWREPEVAHQFFRGGEAVHFAEHGHEGKCNAVTNLRLPPDCGQRGQMSQKVTKHHASKQTELPRRVQERGARLPGEHGQWNEGNRITFWNIHRHPGPEASSGSPAWGLPDGACIETPEQELSRLRREYRELHMRCEILKKTVGIFSAPSVSDISRQKR